MYFTYKHTRNRFLHTILGQPKIFKGYKPNNLPLGPILFVVHLHLVLSSLVRSCNWFRTSKFIGPIGKLLCLFKICFTIWLILPVVQLLLIKKLHWRMVQETQNDKTAIILLLVACKAKLLGLWSFLNF